MRYCENPRWRPRRHLGFTKMLIASAFIELFGLKFELLILGIIEIGKFNQKCEILKIQDGGRPPILDLLKY